VKEESGLEREFEEGKDGVIYSLKSGRLFAVWVQNMLNGSYLTNL
jgi:hypothetical protein